MKRWLVAVWVVLVLGGWAFTESINDGIEPSSGPGPSPSAPESAPAECPSSDKPETTITVCAYKPED
ncbi:hypothetical protein ACFQVC_38190 [Streptomyces monticola]|uniref:Secreted protein n=1 Tax=Streptomyces monticola TaxID=2666263 RepID=A0ABW2JXC5_9ACTN